MATNPGDLVLDPFWNSKTQASKDPWSMSLGPVQYAWLQQVLASSKARFKLVFLHNLVGGVNPTANGVDQGPMRGGVEVAKFLEWGGYNYDGTWGFSTFRPNMAMPIRSAMAPSRSHMWMPTASSRMWRE